MSIEAYRERVAKLARERDGAPIFNGSTEHASVIIENMFAHACDKMWILSGNMNARAYGPDEVLEEAGLFMTDSSHSMRVLVEKADIAEMKSHPFFKKFKDSQNFECKVVPVAVQEKYDFHFLVMDDDSYRFEEDKTKHSAIAAFGDKAGADNLSEIYSDIWGLSDDINLNN